MSRRRVRAGLGRLIGNDRAAAAIEFALVFPAVVIMMIGILQFGLFYFGSATMQHMLGEGARYAILYPTPTDAQILSRMENSRYSQTFGDFTPSITSTANTKDLTVTFTFTPTIPFQMFGPITVTRSKLVYLSV